MKENSFGAFFKAEQDLITQVKTMYLLKMFHKVVKDFPKALNILLKTI